ncbi:MAG: hypothetical protein QOK10_161 [Pseudonocardiales bacterium]|jgi:hypothetical protein|nr:hypothetical protein [Pseudonocardiales bacterium]
MPAHQAQPAVRKLFDDGLSDLLTEEMAARCSAPDRSINK